MPYNFTPEATVTYQVDTSSFQSRARVVVECPLVGNGPTISPAGGSANVKLITTDGVPYVQVGPGNSRQPVTLAIAVQDATGRNLVPLAIVIRASNGVVTPAQFPVALLSDGTNGAQVLVLIDNDDAPANYEFDLLFTDNGNFGLLDPKLVNS